MKRKHRMVKQHRNRARNGKGTRQHTAVGRDAIWQQRSAPIGEMFSKLLAGDIGILQQGFIMMNELLKQVTESRSRGLCCVLWLT